jgi:cell division protein FtsI/penicillin-binding protein 2
MMLTKEIDSELMRVRVVMFLVVCVLLFLAMTLWRIQVFSTSEYSDSLHKQSMRRVRLPGPRGCVA